ncbi:uncharacterized protein Z520_01859 [Fonsecaea multimorphosa CBS 102226]|uniref:Uncharacterized protein n=1 Tax=Fonsecaea multimorphosa CBS 102226 TaxID=1442371 RepID=A0A0D2HIH6_9EURO|nr:uncharacterized protein Z520_01859 [Fonsecaea multimorphosa CBS 102226]KIY01721.1 hypothetical protein Z520_01859 [Fonsecaea multimorphosa CBS 102226]OAL29916.1 hypothetical protein AYO22_01822 [Fonsecaea multimorphosa]
MAPIAIPSSDASANGVESAPKETQPLCAIVTPLGMLGYGFEEHLLTDKLDELTRTNPSVPLAVVMDSGSTDSGPSKLALGTMTCPEASYKRDLTKLIRAVINYHVPVLISSVGGDGSNEHVDLFVEMIKEISALFECPRELKVLAVYSEVSKEVVEQKLLAGDISGCGDEVPQLTIEEIHAAPRILAQMGPEPIFNAMQSYPNFDILVTGRAYDPATFVAFCAINRLKSSSSSFNSLGNNLLGGFCHMGKVMECGGLCATPKSSGATALVYKDGTFDISPLDPMAKCVPLSVAAHTLYEKSRPDLLHGPGGYLDLTHTTYEQLPDGISVRVRGGDFHFSVSEGSPYTVKLEGARVIGFRNLFIGSFKDPILIGQIHEYLEAGKNRIARQHRDMDGRWKLDFHIYGAPESRPDGLTSTNETWTPKEVFIVGEVLADSPTLAKTVASTARVYCSHGAYKGQMATSGNFAFGIGGVTEIDVGPCCQFSIYHLMNLLEGEEDSHYMSDGRGKIVAKDRTMDGLFPWETTVIPASTSGVMISNGTIPVQETKVPTNGAIKRPAQNETKHSIQTMGDPKTLRDVAKVIRSKNAGPFQLTFDVIFDDPVVYKAVKTSGILDGEAMAQLFGRSVDEVVYCGFFDQALAFKLTLPRKRGSELSCSGGYMESDVHGSQQYLPLMKLPLTEDLRRSLLALNSACMN